MASRRGRGRRGSRPEQALGNAASGSRQRVEAVTTSSTMAGRDGRRQALLNL